LLNIEQNAGLPPIFDVLPPSFNPKDGLLRINEFTQILSSEEMDQDRRSIDPKVKKRKQSSSKTLSLEDIFNRQHRAAKNIAATCQWVIQQVEMGRIRNTFNSGFEVSHFTDIAITQREMKWLEDHNSVEKVLNENVIAYAHAPKWEPFPKVSLSIDDLRRIEDAKKNFVKEVEEAKKLAQALLVRLGDNASDDQHIIEYGEQSTEWIASKLRKKSSTTNKPSASITSSATSATMMRVTRKCDVEECILEAVEGACGDNIGCSILRFCSMHLPHSSHNLHRISHNPVNLTVI